MPYGGPKQSLRTSSIVQIIFSFWSFEISEGILRNQKIIICLDSFSNQLLIYSSKDVLHHLDFFIFLSDILTNKFIT